MSDSVKQKKPIHYPLFYGGFSFHMQGMSFCKYLLICLTVSSRKD
jgi:hypothetical protein